jgi:hypothetical protein
MPSISRPTGLFKQSPSHKKVQKTTNLYSLIVYHMFMKDTKIQYWIIHFISGFVTGASVIFLCGIIAGVILTLFIYTYRYKIIFITLATFTQFVFEILKH